MTHESNPRHPVEELAEDFVARSRRGERPAVADYVKMHPDLAAEIEELFPALVFLEKCGQGAPSVTTVEIGRLGDYRLIRELGRGGMGIVYEAVQESLARRVALKVLPAESRLKPRWLDRFQREAEAAARLHHTNIVPVYGVGAADGHHFFAMQFIDGESLRDLLARATDAARTAEFPSPVKPTAAGDASTAPLGKSATSAPGSHLREVAQIGVQVADALAYAHGQGILHRDIKPGNLMRDRQGTIWVTDFGLAKVEGADDLTATGDLVGTLRYMPPERFQGKEDARSDVYSLGLTLYELAGRRPAFDQTDRTRLMHQLMHDTPTPLRQINPRIPRDLETIIHKAMDRDPARRYANAAELADDLRRFLADIPVLARRISSLELARRWCARNPWLAGLMSFSACLLVVVTVVSLIAYFRISSALAAETLALDAETRARKDADRRKFEADLAKTEAERRKIEADNAKEGEKVERLRAVAAERKAKERLFEAKVAQAEASQWSGRPGQRFTSLAALAEAAQLMAALDLGPATGLDLRNRAIVSLTRADLRPFPDGQQPKVPGNPFDGTGAWRIGKVDKDRITFQSRKDPRQEFQISASGSNITKNLLSPCGLFLALSINQEVQVWALGERTLLCTVPERGPLAFSPDSACLVVCISDGSLRIVDLPKGREAKGRDVKGSEVRSLAFASPQATRIAVGPGGRRVALVRKSEVAVVDLHTGATIAAHELPGTIIGHLNWHPQGTLLAFTSNPLASPPVNKPPASGPKIVVWAPDSANEPLLLDGHSKSISALAFHASGLVLASAGGDGTVRLLDAWTGKPLLSLQLSTTALTFGPDEDVLAWRYPGPNANKVGYLQAATGRECRTLASHGQAALGGLDISSNERWLASSGSGNVRLWDLEAGKEIAFLKSKAAVPDVAFDPNNGNLVTSAVVQTVRVVPGAYENTRHELVSDGANSMKLVPLPLGPPADVWRPRGTFLFVDAAKKRHFRGAISEDGRWLLKGLSAPLVTNPVFVPPKPSKISPPTLTDRDSGAVHELLPFHADVGLGQPAAQFALSPDGRRLVAASAKTYHFWQVEPLKHTGVLARQPGNVGVAAVAFSPDSRMAAVVRSPMQISLVDPETLEEFAILPAPNPEVLVSLCFSPKGRWLAAGTQSGSIQVWDVRSIRRQLAEIGLDWKLKPWEPAAGK